MTATPQGADARELRERLEEIETELTDIANGASYPQGCATRALMSLAEVSAALERLEAFVEGAFKEGYEAGAAFDYDADELETEWLESDSRQLLATPSAPAPGEGGGDG